MLKSLITMIGSEVQLEKIHPERKKLTGYGREVGHELALLDD